MTPARREWIIRIVVFACSFAFRLIYIYDISDSPTFSVPIHDAQNYDLYARRIVAGAGLDEQMFWQPFAYPLLLAGIYAISDGSMLAARIVHALVGSITCALIYVLAARSFNRTAGLLASALFTLNGPILFYETEPVANVWAAFFAALLILLFLRAAESPALWLAGLLGICSGLAVLVRPTFIPFVFVTGVWLGWTLLRRGRSPRNTATALGIAAAGFLIVATPLAILTHSVTGKLTILPASGGMNLFMGNNPRSVETEAATGWEYVSLRRVPAREGVHGIWDEDQFFARRARGYIIENPFAFTSGMLRKTLQFFASREIPSYEDPCVERRWSWILSALVWEVDGFGFPFGILLPLGAAGYVLYGRRLPRPVTLFLLLDAAAIILVHVMGRYRTPFVSIWCIPAAAGVLGLVEALANRRWRHLLPAGAVAVAAAALSTLPGPFRLEKLNAEAEMHLSMGYYAQQRFGDPSRALRAYQQAIALDPGNPAAHFNAGIALSELRRPVDAMQSYRQAISLAPQYPEFHYNLANTLVAAGQPDEAIQHYEEAVRLDPTSASAHYNLAYVLTDRGRKDEAIEHYRAALRLRPGWMEAGVNLAMLLEEKDRLGETFDTWMEVVTRNPRNPDLRCRFGDFLLRRGRPREAAAQYQQALRLNPRSGWAAERLAEIAGSPRASRPS